MTFGMVVLTTCPPWTTWIHPSPRSICWAEGPACLAFGAAGLLVACFYSQKGHPLYKCRLCFFPLYTTTVVRCVVSPIATAIRLSPKGRESTGDVGPPYATHRGVYPQLRCVCP
jgi:hypothetical protein